MDRQNFYTDQLVTASQMMSLQTVARDQFTRFGQYVAMPGPAQGLGVTANSPAALNVIVPAGFAFLPDGTNVDLPSQTILSLATDYLAASTDVAVAGQSRWLSIFAVYQQVDDTPVARPDTVVINYLTHDQIQLIVVQGTAATIPTRPALGVLGSNAVLLADVKRSYGVTTISASDVDLTRVVRSQSCKNLYDSLATVSSNVATLQTNYTSLNTRVTALENRGDLAHTFFCI